MMVCGDFIALCLNEACANWGIALILGISISISIKIVVNFHKWKIKKEQEFDKAIFEKFGK